MHYPRMENNKNNYNFLIFSTVLLIVLLNVPSKSMQTSEIIKIILISTIIFVIMSKFFPKKITTERDYTEDFNTSSPSQSPSPSPSDANENQISSNSENNGLTNIQSDAMTDDDLNSIMSNSKNI